MQLSNKQRQVVEHSGNCLALSCPGSGKTRVLVAKTQHILQTDLGARILVVSFTKESASEIRRRIVAEVGKEAARKVITGTFHSIALDQLRRLDKNFKYTVIGPGQMKHYVDRALSECKLSNFPIEEAVALIEMAKLSPDFEPENDDHGRLFAAYSNLTERNNVIDFAEMLAKSVRMMRSGELKPKEINYLLTDESQDQDEMQLAWCVEHIKAGANFTIVGDDDQSIYKFRHALGFAGMMRYHENYGADIIKLDTNYRSRSEILNAAGKLIRKNTHRLDKALDAVRGAGGTVEVWECGKSASEAMLVVKKIQTLCADNPNPYPDLHSVGVQEREWAVLARNNHNLTDLSLAFVAHGIPHTSSSGFNLWDERPVCLALGLLSSLLTGKKAGFEAALHFSGIDEIILEKLHQEFADDFSNLFYGHPIDADRYGVGTATNIQKFAEKIPQWHRSIAKGRINLVVRGAFDWFLDHAHTNSNRDEDSKKGGVQKRISQREIYRLQSARDIFADMNGDLSKRLSMVMTKPNNDKRGETNTGVLLSTLHGSKGLEFKNIWMVQMEDGVIPDVKESTSEILEEERRLFYVGMTRAEDRLYMSYLKNPSGYILETGIPIESIVVR